jgi:alkanesulfonate monooxygenase SsuD/methylene tetrahydromethanopterin reductase-like flavin-dependent oxidoreductase (luciferase family)
VKLGLALPSFVTDPDDAIRVARASEASGLDGVFVYDHLFRAAPDGRRRPALECVSLLGRVAADTERLQVGTLVARASLRPPATLAAALETVARVAPGRLVAGIGAGDSSSEPENDAFGVPAPDPLDRVARLRAAVTVTRDRGFPVWAAGRWEPVRAVAAEAADGWNEWGTSVRTFERRAASVRKRAVRTPFTCSWGGLVVVHDDDRRATERARDLGADRSAIVGGPDRVAARMGEYVAAGAGWVIAAAVDAGDVGQAARLGGEVLPRLRSAAD